MRNYLRVRGEYRSRSSGVRSRPELPPRARRIPLPAVGGERHPGTTSACAENTAIFWLGKPRHGNYLRVRGEYSLEAANTRLRVELPPRARRILRIYRGWCTPLGTTSACAENTTCLVRDRNIPWNYLRVRGEYSQPLLIASPIMELPPRARRIRIILENHTRKGGTTSACAENTLPLVLMGRQKRNYLRVRGEYTLFPPRGSQPSELPPRARRIP